LDCDLMKFCNSFLSSAVSLTVYFCDFIIPLYVVLLCYIIYHLSSVLVESV
jgi:hypothetical protein